MEERKTKGAVGVGLLWGVIGGVVGFLVSLLGSLAGMVAAGFIGVSVGRRAAEAEKERWAGALAGLVGGAVAAPVVVIGATAGALVGAQSTDLSRLAVQVSEILGSTISPDETWRLILLAVAFAAVLQIALLIGASAVAGAWASRKRAS